jgi:hypothetical protein
VQLFRQHSVEAAQGSPLPLQEAELHNEPMQNPEQQSDGETQDSLIFLQTAVLAHRRSLQNPEQHSRPEAHAPPSAAHCMFTAHTEFSHFAEQHSELAEHWSFMYLHPGVGGWTGGKAEFAQNPPWQISEQHSEPTAQEEPMLPQVGVVVQAVFEHKSLQQ